VLRTTLIVLVLMAVLFGFVYPTRTLLDQRNEMGRAEQQLADLRAETQRLRDAAESLEGDAEVEEIAREQYGLVRPGETAYVIMPVPDDEPEPAPDAQP
jgi:cell division protein FtsL